MLEYHYPDYIKWLFKFKMLSVEIYIVDEFLFVDNAIDVVL